MPSKKNRTKNFDGQEKQYLIDLLQLYRNIIENKKTDSSTNLKKVAAWDEITKKFNSVNNRYIRTSEQLKNCYENIKKRAKKNLADGNVSI